jgi:hypothetical protein
MREPTLKMSHITGQWAWEKKNETKGPTLSHEYFYFILHRPGQ